MELVSDFGDGGCDDESVLRFKFQSVSLDVIQDITLNAQRGFGALMEAWITNRRV